ncbi:hypothetical protein [Candidatus Phytoplasma sp. AldY-WA1]|uniref:hypothetical protein n=1 Tax=Candidatus Phytoplasma sp. AldY-WA1 TaxID=2852100 RepID=UPI00254AFF57|nr:hypothetical protein [Candidatus Phytoplasma sp. AldY-WA1]
MTLSKQCLSSSKIPNNDKDIPEYHLLLEIKELEIFLEKNNFFEDFKKQLFYSKLKKEQFKENSNLKKFFLLNINKLNIKYKDNILKIINQKKEYQKKDKINYEDYNFIIQKIKNKIEQKKIEKKKIYQKFKVKQEKIKQNNEQFLKNFLKIQKETILKKEKLKKIFLEHNQILSENIKTITYDIIKDFEQKHIHSNNQINQIKQKHKDQILNIEIKYNSYLNQIQKEQKEKEKNFSKTIQKNNIFFQKKLNQHNKILNEIQQIFCQKENNLKEKTKKLIKTNKLKMFGILEFKNNTQNTNFIILLKTNKQNKIENFKNIYLWQLKYIFLKSLSQKNIKIINIENISEETINNLKIQQNKFSCQKEKEIIDNHFLKEIKLLELNFQIAEIIKKYKNINKELKEIKEQEEIKYSYEHEKYKVDIELNHLEYHKKKITTQQEKEEKENLIKIQSKIELIKFDSKYLENIIENINQTINLNKKIIDLEQTHYKNNIFKNINFEQQTEFFHKRTDMEKLEIEYDIKNFFLYKKNILDNLILFIDYMDSKNQIQNNLFYNLKNQTKKYLEQKTYQTKELIRIQNLCKLFLNNFQNKQFDSLNILREEMDNLEQLNLQKEIDLYNNIYKYTKKNIFYIHDLVNKNKLKNKKDYFSIENEIKIYERNYIFLKKTVILLQEKKQKKQLQNKKYIQKIKKIQEKKIKKHILYQNKISFYLNKITNLKTNPSLIKKIYFRFCIKKIISYYLKELKNIQFLNKFLNKEYIYLSKIKYNFNKDIKLEQTELLNKMYQKMLWLSENFLKITQEIHKINIQKTKKIQIKEKYNLDNQFLNNKKIFENKLQQRRKENILIKENFKDVLIEIQNHFKKKLNQIETEKLNKENDLIQDFNIQKKLFLQKQKIEKDKNDLITKMQAKEEQKLLITRIKIQKKYNSHNLFLSKQKEKNKKNFKKKISYFSWIKKIHIWKTKIFFYFKNIKNKLELKKTYSQNKKKLNHKIKIQLFLYNQFILFL